MSNNVIKTYREALVKTRKRFIGFGRKKAILEARQDLKNLYKQLKDELDDDYAALIANGIAEIDINQCEFKSGALWKKKSADDLMKNRNDETQRLLSMEYYESVVQNLIKSKSTQVAGAILFHVIDQLKDGTCQPYVNQHIEDPKLRKAAPAQLAPYLNQAAKIRNDESSAIILLKAACFVSDYVDASRSYLNRATKIQNSYDAQILALLLSIKYDDFEELDPIDWDSNKEETEFDIIYQTAQYAARTPDNKDEIFDLVNQLSQFISIIEIETFCVEVLVFVLAREELVEPNFPEGL